MSFTCDFDVGPKNRGFRRAVEQDKGDIALFWKKEETETLFCDDDFGSLIELSTLAIVMVDGEQNIKGFLALSDYPPIPAVNPADWEVWVRNMFHKYYLSSDTLFIHFMCCVDSVSDFFLEEALISVFMNDFYLQQIILVVPSTCKINCIEKYPVFKRRSIYLHCSIHGGQETCICLFVAKREHFCPNLKVRRAVEEDNDDVVAILDKNKLLKELYGEYYISEIVSRCYDDNRIVMVAELNEQHQDKQKVVGAMCLNSTINYKKLQNTYDLAPYHGLVKVDIVKREKIKRTNTLLQTYGDPILRGDWSPFDIFRKRSLIDRESPYDKPSTEPRERRSKVNFRVRRSFQPRSAPLVKSSEDDTVKHDSSTMSINADRSMMWIIDDDEPLDYEIVNIDENLLNIRDVSSYTNLHDTEVHRTKSGHRIRKKRATMTKVEEDMLFEGEPNAFTIELFGISDIIDDRCAFDMLKAAFECMPNFDYCVIRIPTGKISFSLLQHFTVVPSKSHVCCRYALYVAHRNSVLGRLRVRKVEVSDIPQIAMFLHNVEGKETIWTVEQALQAPHRNLAYVFLNGYSIIGLGVLDPPKHTDVVRVKFVLEEFQNNRYHVSGQGLDGGISMVKTVLVYPAFEPHLAFFARDMMRLSGSTSLMWLTAYRNKWVTQKANGLVTAMTPLTFRAAPSYGMMPYLQKVYSVSKNLLSFSAWYISKKLTSVRRLNIDNRIVVVGASRTAMAFLNTLIFGDSATYLTYTNITLVSTNGLPYLRNPIPCAEYMFPRYKATNERFLKSTPFTYYVNVVQATMVDINKQNKYIVIENGNKYYYDNLFLFIGKQIQHPDYMKALRSREKNIRQGNMPKYVRMDDPRYISSQIEPTFDYDTPENVFFVNNLHDANRALTDILTFSWRYDDYKLIVYGSDIHAYCCLSTLIELEVPTDQIIFVESFPPEDERKPRVPFFSNDKVDKTIKAYLDTLDLQIYRGYHFDKWNVDEYDRCTSVEFISHYGYLKLDCAALFFYGKRFINPQAFVAINKCGIAYDGGILIDNQWKTNDPSIYAAGTVTHYQRQYFAHDEQHKFYDSYDVGRWLGTQIRNQLDPFFTNNIEPKPPSSAKSERYSWSMSSDSHCSSASDTSDVGRFSVPRLRDPVFWYCILPGNLQYLEVRPPGTQFPHYYVQSMDYNGTVIETYKTGYFKLHINKDKIVDGITCLTPDPTNIEHLKMLYGHSVIVLNNVLIRFKAGNITDFFDFFRLPWSIFLYNNRAEELLFIGKNLKPKDKPDGKTVEETLHKLSATLKDTKIPKEMMGLVRGNLEKNFEAITDYVIEWLSDNDQIRPPYATPYNITWISHDPACDNEFKRCKRTINKMLAMIA